MKLILFDIDGTLLLTDGAGRRAVHHALLEVFGTTGPPGHHFDGKTDPQIVRELMTIAGHSSDVVEERAERCLALYVERLHIELRAADRRPYTLPGVPELLDALEARDDVILGLLTGNLFEGARAKVDAVGLGFDRFVVGAYGSDHAVRSELPAIAQRRLEETRGVRVQGREIVVIGDTPADIECGRALDVHAVGVATGRYSVEELARHGAHAVLPDLSDTAAALAAILDERG